MLQTIRPALTVLGEVALPADKSVAHRTAILSALAEGTSQIVNYPDSADPQSTLSCLRQLGVEIYDRDGIMYLDGRGGIGLLAPSAPLDCGNSGTTMRLLAGVLAGQPFNSILVGDASLSRRPMTRIAEPLRAMGAHITLSDGHAPVRISGGHSLKGIAYRLPVASAQVKSCVLLAGLFAEGETTVIESISSRDHTERMLGLDVFEMEDTRHFSVRGGYRMNGRTWAVPRDFSAAAYFLVAGSIVPEGELRLLSVGMNPSRIALLHILLAMGANITVEREREHGGEPLADLVVRPASLHGVSVGNPLIPNLIDEIPALVVAAACANGSTIISDAGELRVKETDRLAALTANLRILGVDLAEQDDGLAIHGPATMVGATVDSFDDHRIAMAMGVAGLVATGQTTIRNADCSRISFPNFWKELKRIRQG